ncbi:MAG: THUMP domain-containing protein [Reinekea sp.]
MKFVVKLFPEITIKTKPVRKLLTQQLTQNIRNVLRRITDEVKIRNNWDAIEVWTPDDALDVINDDIYDALACIPGIAHINRVREFPLGSLDDVVTNTLSVWQDELVGKRFVVRVKRTGTHDFTSVDAERYVGGGLRKLSQAQAVDLHNPDIMIRLEIKHSRLFVIDKRVQGLGGFPLGAADSTVTLVSGGFDSTVATYQMIRRGIKTHFLFFNLGYMGVVLKRMMMRAANRVCERIGLDSFVTGEALSQVSSQTMTNQRLIDDVADRMVIRPLAVTDKHDIVTSARQIGAASFVERIPEYCGVISRKPNASCKREDVERVEAEFDLTVLDDALAAAKVEPIDKMRWQPTLDMELSLNQNLDSSQALIIDVRHPQEIELSPLKVDGHEILEIPFYSLNRKFASLDHGKEYLLYCDKGVMSKMHALHLADAGFNNVGIYRPAVD